MLRATLLFLGAITLCQNLSSLPSPFVIWGLVVITLFLGWARQWYSLVFCLGLLWTFGHAQLLMQQQLPAQFAHQSVEVVGTIISIPQQRSCGLQFFFEISKITINSHHAKNTTPSSVIHTLSENSAYLLPKPLRAKIHWNTENATLPNASLPHLQAGQQWQMLVRLYPLRGFSNPTYYDYHAFVFQQQLQATGYILSNSKPQLLTTKYTFETFRQQLFEQMQAIFQRENLAFAGMLTALALGEQQGISPEQWTILNKTGVGHLISISGSHVSVLAGLCFILLLKMAGFFPKLLLHIPAHRWAAVGSMLLTLFYALLAGFSIPTQRACIMVWAVMASWLVPMIFSLSQRLMFALLIVLLFQPLAVLSQGFWLSFFAIAIILYVHQGRRIIATTHAPLKIFAANQVFKTQNAGKIFGFSRQQIYEYGILYGQYFKKRCPEDVQKFSHLQIAITVGMIPLSLLFFGYFSLSGLLANAVAIPLVTVFIVPLLLITLFSFSFFEQGFTVCLKLAVFAWQLLWDNVLTPLADLQLTTLSTAALTPWIAVIGFIGVALILLPRGVLPLSVKLAWLLPLFFSAPAALKHGQMEFTLLDVGQGLAVLLQTAQHNLLYDSGDASPCGINMGSAVVNPVLQKKQIKQLDAVILSHDDRDHIGGITGVNLPIQQLFTPAQFNTAIKTEHTEIARQICQAGKQWQWDGVQFEFINSLSTPSVSQVISDNDQSCVLRVTTANHTVLLTGDISQQAEQHLLRTVPEKLAADILIVPHHGSRYSSSWEFIKAVRPRYALFSTGYYNRFGFPKAEIVQRYQAMQAIALDTATAGAIQFQLHDPILHPPTLYRLQNQRYYHNLEQ